MKASASNPTKAEKAQETRKRNRAAKAEAERSEREAARQAIISRYGSEEAARAPTEREKVILDAGAEFDRRRAAGEVAEGEFRRSFKAWPMPKTYEAALKEQADWHTRSKELEVLGSDLPYDLKHREEVITNLVEWDMPLHTVEEIHDRLKCFTASRETHTDYAYALNFVVDAVERDLGAMVDRSGRGEALSVFDVDAKGHADGEPLNRELAEEFVEAGYGVNLPCVIRYPDGQLDIGHKVAFTPAGIAWLRQEMEAGRF